MAIIQRKFSLEDYWFMFAIGIIIAVGLYTSSWLETLGAVSNVACVILVAKGRISNYIWGMLGVLIYGWLSYQAGYIGNALLNFIYYVPMQIVGWLSWKDNKTDFGDVKVKELGFIKGSLISCGLMIGTLILTWFLYDNINWSYNYIINNVLTININYADSYTALASVVAMLLLVGRYKAQWVLWITVNIVTIWMWYDNYQRTGEGLVLIVMWLVFLINSLFGFYKWYIVKENK